MPPPRKPDPTMAPDRPGASTESRLIQQMVLSAGAAENSRAALEILLMRACTLTGWAMGQAWFPDVPARALACRGPWLEYGVDFAELRRESAGLAIPPGVDLPGRAWIARLATACRDLTGPVPGARWRLAHRLGVTAGFAIPVLAGEQSVAVLEFFSTGSGIEDLKWLELLETAAA